MFCLTLRNILQSIAAGKRDLLQLYKWGHEPHEVRVSTIESIPIIPTSDNSMYFSFVDVDNKNVLN